MRWKSFIVAMLVGAVVMGCGSQRRTEVVGPGGTSGGGSSGGNTGNGGSGGSGGGGGGGVGAASFAPVESPRPVGYVSQLNPPAGFGAIMGWMQTIDIDGQGHPSTVEVDWMRLHASVNSHDTVIAEENFGVHASYFNYYGIYARSPWFAGDRLGNMPFAIQAGTLNLEPGSMPSRVFHWWTTRVNIPSGTSRVWFEARVRITGRAGVQSGIDFWRDLSASYAGPGVNNTEAAASNWYGPSTSDWQVISVGKP